MYRPGLLLRLRDRIAPALLGPPALAFLHALSLGAFWLGGEPVLILVSLGLPLVVAVAQAPGPGRDRVTGLLQGPGFERVVERVYAETAGGAQRSACVLLELEEFGDLAARHGPAAAEEMARLCGRRIRSVLRAEDTAARLGETRFGICLAAIAQLDLENCIQLAGRLQAAVEEPAALDGTTVYLSCSIGFCLRSRAPGRQPGDWIAAAEAALADARQHAPASIRAYAPGQHRRAATRSSLRHDVATALENGQILAHFQPQLSTETGALTGWEALARWNHPDHGIIAPAEFLQVIEDADQMQRLGQVMLTQALTALAAWDSAGLNVPAVSVNFSPGELSAPDLPDRVAWELERHGIAPERLVAEILETVVARSPDDVTTRTIRALHRLGCRIDLDDFGVGQASIAAIRRFGIHRIKIDRGFVLKADQDPEQQKMISAILTMAERLEVATLAEGVETPGEYALLSQLGCGYVQGFAIAQPMPFEATLDWIAAHKQREVATPAIGRRRG